MRTTSAVLSLFAHVALALAALFLTARGDPPDSPRPEHLSWVLPHALRTTSPLASVSAPSFPDIGALQPFPPIDVGIGIPDGPPRPAIGPGPTTFEGPNLGDGPLDASLTEEPPVLLAAPMPAYPELLRQAGVPGRVLLQAVVDTAGRVERGSIEVVSATHPAFAAPAERALTGALFRPARVHGRPVRVRIRLPIDFVVRGPTF